MTICTKTKKNTLRNISAKTDKRIKPVWDIDTGTRYDSPADCAKVFDVDVTKVYAVCNKKIKTCKGHHLRYEEDVEDVRTDMGASIASKDTENASLRAENEFLRAEVERLRKVECVRIENQDKIARLEKSIACHKRAYDSHMKAAGVAMKYMAARQKELDELLNGRK